MGIFGSNLTKKGPKNPKNSPKKHENYPFVQPQKPLPAPKPPKKEEKKDDDGVIIIDIQGLFIIT